MSLQKETSRLFHFYAFPETGIHLTSEAAKRVAIAPVFLTMRSDSAEGGGGLRILRAANGCF